MKTKKQTRQNNTRMTRCKRSSRVNKRAQHGGGLHKLMVDEKQLFDLLQVSRLTPPDLRKTGVIIPRVLELLESRMLMLKNYTDINGFVYITKNRPHCIPFPDDPNKRISTIGGIAHCFGRDSNSRHRVNEIKAGFDAEKRLHQLLKTFMATMKALKFHACMQVEFNGFGGSHSLGNLIWFTMNRCENLSHDESMTLRQLSNDIDTAIRVTLTGMRSQIYMLHDIRTNAIPAMVKVYQGKDNGEWDHTLWETIPSFLNPDGTEGEFKEAVDKFRTKLDAAIAQKENALNSGIEFVDPLNLTHISHRSVPASYAKGVLQQSRPPKHAIGQIAADIAFYDPDIDPKKRMSQMRGLRDSLIKKLTMPPSHTPGAHASLQSKFYHTPEKEKEKEKEIDPPPLPVNAD
jgi:hypothetical protein